MGSMRRGSSRSTSARRGRISGLEVLESRQLMTANIGAYPSLYVPTDLYVRNPVTNVREGSVSAYSLYRQHDVTNALVSNEGKIVTGKDRSGNEWTITVHGPGKVIVTDTTPNDGALDDDIATIQIVGSSLNSTYVTGSTVASTRTTTSGTVRFNRLIAAEGVRSIQLNGFDLTSMVTPAVVEQTGVFLYGGVQVLEFHDVIGLFDTAGNPSPYQIQIGQANSPLRVKPSIYLDSIYNSVYNSEDGTIPTAPVTTPWIQFSVNGVVQEFSIVSATQSALPPNYVTGTQQGTIEVWSGVPTSGPPPAAYQFLYNIVGTTGRTSLQAVGVNNLKVRGSARNFTAQRDTTPFTSSTSGLSHLRRAEFGGVADGLALDVNGPIGKLRFNRGLGDPTAVYTASTQTPATEENPDTQTILLPATYYGTPAGSTGYPAAGLLGGAIRGRTLGSMVAKSNGVSTIAAQNPDYVFLRRIGYPTYTQAPGMAVTNSSVTTTGSIDHVNIDGNQLNSAIASGFDYQAYRQGLQASRSPSRIGSYRQQGDLINSVVTASAQPVNNDYRQGAVFGDGSITGHVTGKAYDTDGRNALSQFGAGVFARRKVGRLPIAP